MGMQACLIQWPELVTCPSAQCTEESGGGGSGGNTLTATLELEASATFSPQAAHVRQTHKKKGPTMRSGRPPGPTLRRRRLLAFTVARM